MATRSWTGDHDLNCGAPDTQRTIQRCQSERLVLHVSRPHDDLDRRHLRLLDGMVLTEADLLGATAGVLGRQRHRPEGRQWWEVSIVPAVVQLRRAIVPAVLGALTGCRRPGRAAGVPEGLGGGRQGARSATMSRCPPTASTATSPSTRASATSIRRAARPRRSGGPFSITDNRNGTITVRLRGLRDIHRARLVPGRRLQRGVQGPQLHARQGRQARRPHLALGQHHREVADGPMARARRQVRLVGVLRGIGPGTSESPRRDSDDAEQEPDLDHGPDGHASNVVVVEQQRPPGGARSAGYRRSRPG